jgi:hypothetical protein
VGRLTMYSPREICSQTVPPICSHCKTDLFHCIKEKRQAKKEAWEDEGPVGAVAGELRRELAQPPEQPVLVAINGRAVGQRGFYLV